MVVGDLVYCKESDMPCVKEIATPVAEDEDSNNTLPNDLDETTVTDIPEEKNISVKVCYSTWDPFRIVLKVCP